MLAHSEPIRDWLKLLRFLVNALLAPPEPRLVHKGPVRRVHQSNDSLIDVRRQVAFQARDLEFLTEFWKLRYRRQSLRQSRSRRVYIHPYISITLFARKMMGANSLRL